MKIIKKILEVSSATVLGVSPCAVLSSCKQPLPAFIDFGSIRPKANDFQQIKKIIFYARDPAKPHDENLKSISRLQIVQEAVLDYISKRVKTINPKDYVVTNNATTSTSYLLYAPIIFTVTATNSEVCSGSFSFSSLAMASSAAHKDLEVIQFEDSYRNFQLSPSVDLAHVSKTQIIQAIKDSPNLTTRLTNAVEDEFDIQQIVLWDNLDLDIDCDDTLNFTDNIRMELNITLKPHADNNPYNFYGSLT
jgi:hypothetical protein